MHFLITTADLDSSGVQAIKVMGYVVTWKSGRCNRLSGQSSVTTALKDGIHFDALSEDF